MDIMAMYPTLRAVSTSMLLVFAVPALAQQYPAKPVRLVVGFAPGGGTDLLTPVFGEFRADHARKQVGAASLVNANGHEVVVVYASEKGSPVIKEVHGESGGVPHTFLDQFKGKGHDSKLRLGQDIKAQGVDEATARALTDAIRLDVVTMQTLYGASHSH